MARSWRCPGLTLASTGCLHGEPRERQARYVGRRFLSSQWSPSLGAQQPQVEAPGHPWSHAVHCWRGVGRAWHCCFALEPSASCSPLPHNRILLVRFGETPRGPPDTSTSHGSSRLPSVGVSAHLFRVASHPAFTPCPVCSARLPGEASCPSSSLWSHARKDSLCTCICKLSFEQPASTKVFTENRWPT